MEWVWQSIAYLAHTDQHLGGIIQHYGLGSYLLLAAVIFCETGLVVATFLPGDSLLFTTATFAAEGFLKVYVLFGLFWAAAVAGDSTNYWIGRFIGPRLFHFPHSKYFNREHLRQAHQFYRNYGKKVVLASRFVPFMRTFVPLSAGISAMEYKEFLLFNTLGCFIWTTIFVFGGYFFGHLPAVKDNFIWVIAGVVIVSLLPAAIALIRHQRRSR